MVSPLVGRRRSPPAWMRDLDTFDRGAPHVRTSALRDWRPTSWCDRSSGARLGHRSYSTLYVAGFGNRQRAAGTSVPNCPYYRLRRAPLPSLKLLDQVPVRRECHRGRMACLAGDLNDRRALGEESALEDFLAVAAANLSDGGHSFYRFWRP